MTSIYRDICVKLTPQSIWIDCSLDVLHLWLGYSFIRLSQVLKGAVGAILCQNEADVKCQMDIDSSISLTEQAGRIRFSLLGLWMRFGGQFPWTFLVVPHSGRALCQLLLWMTDTFDTQIRSLKEFDSHGQIYIECETLFLPFHFVMSSYM